MTYYVVDLGFLASGTISTATAASSDGSVIVGYSNLSDAIDAPNHAFRWTVLGMADLGVLSGGSSSLANGVSGDGTIVVGASVVSGVSHAFVWTAGSGMVDIGIPGFATASVATGISPDGTTVVGNDGGGNAWWWTSGSGFHAIGDLGGGYASPAACSGDGSIIVGTSTTDASETHAFSYTVSGGMVDLGVLSGGNLSEANGIDATGTVIVGIGRDVSDTVYPVTWSPITSLGLPSFGTSGSTAVGVSADGTVIAGPCQGVFPNSFIWTAAGGFVELPNGDCTNLSSNGLVPVGNGHDANDACYWSPEVPPAPGVWTISSSTSTEISAGVGDVWLDDSYVDFSDPTTRAGFISPDGTWIFMGVNGQLATGSSPLNWLRVQTGNPPSDILTGYGQDGAQTPWSLLDVGDDPTTGEPYAAMSFDLCLPNDVVMTIPFLDVSFSTPTTTDHMVTLRWSDDGGFNWSNGLVQSLGLIGEYATSVQFRRIGMAGRIGMGGRTRVLELSWSGAQAEALTGVWVEYQIAAT